MTVTTQNLLKYLPIDDKIRQETLVKLAGYSPQQKISLDETLWLMVHELLMVQSQYEFELALLEIEKGKGEMDNQLYPRIKEQVYMRFLRDIAENKEAESIEDIRLSLQKLIKKNTGKKTVKKTN